MPDTLPWPLISWEMMLATAEIHALEKQDNFMPLLYGILFSKTHGKSTATCHNFD